MGISRPSKKNHAQYSIEELAAVPRSEAVEGSRVGVRVEERVGDERATKPDVAADDRRGVNWQDNEKFNGVHQNTCYPLPKRLDRPRAKPIRCCRQCC